MNSMQGKRVLVTGAGTGIGKGIALCFAQAGAAVGLHYSHSAAGAAAAVDEIRAGGGTAAAFQADFTQMSGHQFGPRKLNRRTRQRNGRRAFFPR